MFCNKVQVFEGRTKLNVIGKGEEHARFRGIHVLRAALKKSVVWNIPISGLISDSGLSERRHPEQ